MTEATRAGHVLIARGEELRTTLLKSKRDATSEIGREKVRLYASDLGAPLKDVKTVVEFLKVTYDACVVQRNLYRKSKILHRDISEGNIMVAPSDEAFYEGCADGYDEVKYINQMLDETCTAKPRPACLLVDLGHSADLGVVQGDPEVLIERTGTPKFIARSVSCGALLERSTHQSNFTQMPSLEGQARELYESTYTKERYKHFLELVPRGNTLPEVPEVVFAHRLFHDAESTFWVISWVLARSAGPNYQQELRLTSQYGLFISQMEQHHAFNTMIDTRDQFLVSDPKYWDSVLHEDLKSLAPMLAEMCAYIRPEWAFRTELKAHPEHVHEALMRLLLKEIVRFGDTGDINLAVGVRPVPT